MRTLLKRPALIGWIALLLHAAYLYFLATGHVIGPYITGSTPVNELKEIVITHQHAWKVAVLAVALAPVFLFCLLVWSLIKKVNGRLLLSLAWVLSVGVLPIALVAASLEEKPSWRVTQTVRGDDGHTYYILGYRHPLVLNESLTFSAVARRTGGDGRRSRAVILKKDATELRYLSVIDAGLKDPDSKIRRVCRMLKPKVKTSTERLSD